MIPMNTHLNPMINNQHSNIHIPQGTPDYTTTLQMICTNMEIMNKKLSKLDGIDKLNEKFDKLVSQIVNMRRKKMMKLNKFNQGPMENLAVSLRNLQTIRTMKPLEKQHPNYKINYNTQCHSNILLK
jgi:small-conductance mechanosensitive channel